MKFSTLALAALVPIGGTYAFVQPRQRYSTFHCQKSTHCYSLATPSSSGRSSEKLETDLSSVRSSSSGGPSKEIEVELSSGRILEGGHVIDFEAVKGPSRAEQALLSARQEVLSHNGQAALSSSTLLGINEEVIQEVGHDLGTFANSVDIQKCAEYLRSLAPSNLFEKREFETTEFSTKDKARFNSVLQRAYVESGEVTGAFAKTFYMGTMLMPEAAREAIWAIYVWCRRTDEIVDAPRDNDEEMLLDLSSWEMRLENLFKYGDVVDVYDLCLLDVLVKYPSLEITPFMDMIRGMLMDVPGLGQDRYDNFDELHLYCYRVAGTVGLMSLPIFGCAPGVTYDEAREPALSLGVAFQITNILRDVGEDAAQRGRVYLPQEDMRRFGVTEEQLFEQRVDQNYINLMKYEIAKARNYYERARRGVFMLAPESRLPVQSSLDAYGGILDKIEQNGYDTLTTRAYVGKWEKLGIIPFSWYRTLDISRSFPLPGDKSVS